MTLAGSDLGCHDAHFLEKQSKAVAAKNPAAQMIKSKRHLSIHVMMPGCNRIHCPPSSLNKNFTNICHVPKKHYICTVW